MIHWRNPEVCLQNSRSMAEHRLQQLRRQLITDPVKLKDMLTSLVISPLRAMHRRFLNIKIKVESPIQWYLSHQYVDKKVLHGPDLTNLLVGILMRFRQEQIALIANLQAHQVKVDSYNADEL